MTVEVAIDITGLDAGEYSGPITVFSSGAQGSPRTVEVHLLIEPSHEVPIVLSAESGYDNIRLGWNPTSSPNVTAYRILRAVEGLADFTAIAVVSDTTHLDDDTALTAGTSYCYYVAALGSDGKVLRESNVDCAVLGQVELWIPDTWAAHGQTRIMPVNVRNATGLSMAASDIWLNFDGTVIELLDVSETPLTVDYTWTYAITSTGTYSQAHIAAYDMSPSMLYGEGSLFWLTFRVTGSEGEESPLNLLEFAEGVGGTTIYTPDDLFNPIPLQLQSGVFHVANGCVLGDLNGNAVVEAVDAYIALQIASGEFAATAEQLLASDVNGNGKVDAGDATMILYYTVHGAWPPPSLTAMRAESAQKGANNSILLSLDDVNGTPGDVVRTTLRAENLSNWAGGELLVAYDTAFIDSIADVEVTGLASSFALEYHDDGTGLLHIALAGNTAISGSGALATISLRIAPAASSGSSTTLALAGAQLNDLAGRDFATSALQQIIARRHGELQVGFYTYLPLILK